MPAEMSVTERSDSERDLHIRIKSLEEQLREALERNEKLEKSIVVCQRNANQKAELYDDAVRMVHTVGMQHSDMIKAQIERINSLEEELETTWKECRRFREVKLQLEAKTVECKELQGRISDLEVEKSSAVSAARFETEHKYEAEIKFLRSELDQARDNHAIESAAFEKYRREIQDIVHEDSSMRSRMEYFRRANEIRALLIRSLEDHVSSAGAARIREAARRLKIAQRSAKLHSGRANSPGAAPPPRVGRSASRSKSQDPSRGRDRRAGPAARPARSATPTGRLLPWRPPSVRTSPRSGSAGSSRSLTPSRRTPPSTGSQSSPRLSDPGSTAGSEREDGKFDFGSGGAAAAAAGFELLVMQLREARRRAADLEVQLEQERSAREPLVRRISALEAAAPHRAVSPAGEAAGLSTPISGPVRRWPAPASPAEPAPEKTAIVAASAPRRLIAGTHENAGAASPLVSAGAGAVPQATHGEQPLATSAAAEAPAGAIRGAGRLPHAPSSPTADSQPPASSSGPATPTTPHDKPPPALEGGAEDLARWVAAELDQALQATQAQLLRIRLQDLDDPPRLARGAEAGPPNDAGAWGLGGMAACDEVDGAAEIATVEGGWPGEKDDLDATMRRPADARDAISKPPAPHPGAECEVGSAAV